MLQAHLICTPQHVRPTSAPHLAPFDQASQKPKFGSNAARGTPEEFLSWAKSQPHSSQLGPPPLPYDLHAAVRFVWSHGPLVSCERRRRIDVLASVARRLAPLTQSLLPLMPWPARAVARAMALDLRRQSEPSATLDDMHVDAMHPPHYALWCAMLDAIRWPHRKLVHDMLHGFPSVGHIPDTGVWKEVQRPASMPFASFVSSNPAWVRQCRQRVLSVAKRDPERAHACWTRTIEERDAGLILGPFTISQLDAKSSTGFPAFGFGMWRPLPRFTIRQKDKWRCIDDGAASGTNSDGTSYWETIVCDRPDSPLRIGCAFHELGSPPGYPQVRVRMGGGTDDVKAAYRVIVTRHPGYTTVMVASPPGSIGPHADWQPSVFLVPGHNFGLASAVLNFYSAAEPPTVFSRLFFGVPVVRYYDDHSVHEPSYAAASGQSCHVALHDLLHFRFDVGKHVPWQRSVLYTGVCTDWSDDAHGRVTVGVSRARRDRVRVIIAEALRSGELSAAAASSLRGKARFCVCPVFGRVGLAAVHLLRERQRDRVSVALSSDLEDALRFLDIVVDLLPDFVVQIRKECVSPACVVLTDASWEVGHTWLGFLVACPIRGAVWAGCPTPPWLLRVLQEHKARKTYIGPLELAVASAVYFSLPECWFTGRAVLHYIDNQPACYSLIKGQSDAPDCNRLVFVTLMKLARMRCDAWFDYVPSASNIADLPTRLDAGAFRRLEAVASRVRLSLPPEWCLSCPHSDLKALFVGA